MYDNRIIRSFLRSSVSKEQLMGPSISVCLSAASFSLGRAAIYQWSYELHVLPYKISRTDDRIFMKFGIEVMPLETCPK
jgi:hypothetical protein